MSSPEDVLNAVFTRLGAALHPMARADAMNQGDGATRQIRSELAARVGVIGADAARRTPASIATEIEAIRQIARRHGLFPAVAVTQALESALARGERGPLIQGWLSLLGEALGCDRQDRAAGESFAAACFVRL